MQQVNRSGQIASNDNFMNMAVRLGVIVFLVFMCFRVFSPFAGVMLWALILAIALYPIHRKLARRFSGRQGLAATVIVLIGLIIIGVPTAILGSSFASHVSDMYTAFENHEIDVKPPPSSVAEWPVIGPRLHAAWAELSEDVPAYIKEHKTQLSKLAKNVFSFALNAAQSIFLFLGSLIIAGIMMAYGVAGSNALRRIYIRIAGRETGEQLQVLSTTTVRSVANGVIGVAFVQALLLGIGFIFAGVPAPGALSLVVLFIGIAQLPALILTIPVVIYIWSVGDASVLSNTIWTAYLIAAGFSDVVLKPLLLGRGVEVPMPVVLLGALGGMVSAGMIGLFVGAVLLAVGYQVFMSWVDRGDHTSLNNEEGAP